MTNSPANRHALSRPSSTVHLYFMVVLRIFIGWHFLYEGIIKLMNPAWTSRDFLLDSTWIFSGVFQWIAEQPAVLQIVDVLNTWGLILAGIGLFFGLFTNLALIAGMILLSLYYIAQPPFITTGGDLFREGNYLFIDKNLIELTALIVLKFFNTGEFLGLDFFIARMRRKPLKADVREQKKASPAEPAAQRFGRPPLKRRELLKQLATLPVMGAFIFAAYKKRRWDHILIKHRQIESGGADMPHGNIAGLRISRLIFGSNVPGSHPRDLMYMYRLGAAYQTKERLLDTYALAESRGINTVLQGKPEIIREYNAIYGGNLKSIRPFHVTKEDDRESIRARFNELLEDRDVIAAFYIFGESGDYLSHFRRIDLIGTSLELAREYGVLLGVGGHSLQVPVQCMDSGIEPDFYVKTFHHDDYWSATPKENRVEFCWYDDSGSGRCGSGRQKDHNLFHDNIWCLDAEETRKVMQKVSVPWIAFKVLAAGAIRPASGFKFAFENGADFIAVGMADFQVEENVKLMRSLFATDIKRERPWRG